MIKLMTTLLHITYPKNHNYQPNAAFIQQLLHESLSYFVLFLFRQHSRQQMVDLVTKLSSVETAFITWQNLGLWAWADLKWGHFKVSSWTFNSEIHWWLNKVCIEKWLYLECFVNCVLLKLYLLWTLYSLEDSDEVKLVW